MTWIRPNEPQGLSSLIVYAWIGRERRQVPQEVWSGIFIGLFVRTYVAGWPKIAFIDTYYYRPRVAAVPPDPLPQWIVA